MGRDPGDPARTVAGSLGSPTRAHYRYAINFRDWPLRREDFGDVGESWAEADADRRRALRRHPVVPLDYPEPVAADWPKLLAIVEERAKPERDCQNRKALKPPAKRTTTTAPP